MILNLLAPFFRNASLSLLLPPKCNIMMKQGAKSVCRNSSYKIITNLSCSTVSVNQQRQVKPPSSDFCLTCGIPGDVRRLCLESHS